MKFEIKEKKKKFVPFTLEIEVETFEQLKELCARFNLSVNKVNDGNGNQEYLKLKSGEVDSYKMWSTLWDRAEFDYEC